MQRPFSQQLNHWLKSDKPKTIQSLTEVFGPKSFAIIILVLMFLPALPIPTAGITHIFELIVMLLAGELIVGRRTVWLPHAWRHMPLGKTMQHKALPLIVRRIRGLERFSRPRLGTFINHPLMLRVIGLTFFILSFSAFVGLPGSGLDTLPSMGAAIIALGLILGDIIFVGAGLLIGAFGVGLVVTTSGLTIHFVEKLLHSL